MWIPLCFQVIGLVPFVVPPKPVQITAQKFFNLHDYRLHDDRTVVLFFFTSFQHRSLKPYLASLQRLDARRDTTVIAVSPEPPRRIERFIARHNVRFVVAAGSKAHEGFKLRPRDFPKVVVLRPPGAARRTNGVNILEDFSELDALFPPTEEPETVTLASGEVLQSGAFDASSPTELLERHASSDPDRSERLRAVSLLRKKLPPEEFMRFCDTLWTSGNWGTEGHWIADRGWLAYQKHLADPGQPDKQPLFPLSIVASRAYREHPDDPRWDRLETYLDSMPERSADELVDDYFAHQGDALADLQIRRQIVRALEGQARERHVEAGRAIGFLRQMLSQEPDAGIRQRIVGAICALGEAGDKELADFLEAQLQTEKDVRLVRPMLEYTIRYLRTGKE
ncbi:MAG: hypothetical protein D6788_05035 [Planctomycetota bacterium]|nr:MAG: hypothetical protein D6788_05035 [Planctomycetota bacterium]